jgi:DNA-binding transcriptional ArsR family regulator
MTVRQEIFSHPVSMANQSYEGDVLDAVIQEAGKLFAALACPTRLQIVCQLRQCEQSVHDLVDHIHGSQPNISSHLRLLRQAGIVCRKRTGREVLYRLNSALAEALCETVCRFD